MRAKLSGRGWWDRSFQPLGLAWWDLVRGSSSGGGTGRVWGWVWSDWEWEQHRLCIRWRVWWTIPSPLPQYIRGEDDLISGPTLVLPPSWILELISRSLSTLTA